MDWTYDAKGKCWYASRPMSEGSNCDFIYCIKDVGNGNYVVDAQNNAYGAIRVAVKDHFCIIASAFNNLDKLKKDIENRNILWLYTGACNCVGLITKEEL